jgi:hypothetical protein
MKTKLLREARRRVQVREFKNSAMIKISYLGKKDVIFKYRGPKSKLNDRVNDCILRVAWDLKKIVKFY